MTAQTLNLNGTVQVAPDNWVCRELRYNGSAPGGAGNTTRGLTRSSVLTREGLAMKATRVLPTRRRVSLDPHPDLAEAVTVSRFWRLVQVGAPSDCWEWVGMKNSDGYGSFGYRGEERPAHEMALSFSTGEMRHPDLVTCHSCDNPSCCNPSHLRFDTPGSNLKDAYDRGRRKGTDLVKYLTDDQVRLMRERRALGARVCDLADQFGITRSGASSILTGRSRAKAGGPIMAPRKWSRSGEGDAA